METVKEIMHRFALKVTDYIHPFDTYKGQDILIFEEFHSNLKIQDMLNYLDGYPLDLLNGTLPELLESVMQVRFFLFSVFVFPFLTFFVTSSVTSLLL